MMQARLDQGQLSRGLRHEGQAMNGMGVKRSRLSMCRWRRACLLTSWRTGAESIPKALGHPQLLPGCLPCPVSHPASPSPPLAPHEARIVLFPPQASEVPHNKMCHATKDSRGFALSCVVPNRLVPLRAIGRVKPKTSTDTSRHLLKLKASRVFVFGSEWAS